MVKIVKYKANKYSKSSNFRINRRIIQEYGLQEAKKIGALDSLEQEKEKLKSLKKKQKSVKKKNKKTSKKTGLHLGVEYQTKYNEFLINGGNPEDCPF
jgi:hypothetical protein